MLELIQTRLDRNSVKSIEDQPSVISAELQGSDTAVALGITAKGYNPILSLCRSLIAAGLSPDAALLVHRNGLVTLKIRSLREGARLTVEDDKNSRPKFRLARPERGGAASLARKMGRA